ncbi:MAG: M36 family metallopeptidase [Solirubrobacteraceae bacterium]
MTRRSALPLVLAAALLGPAGAAVAAEAPGADVLVDVREGPRAEAIAERRTAGDVPAGSERAARALVRRQGALTTLEADPTTQTVRSLVDLSGALSGVTDGSPVRIARDYAMEHRVALGLTAADFDTFKLASADMGLDGVTHVRWTQEIGGVPAYDNGLIVDVDRVGRVISVGGSPLHDPEPGTAAPKLSRAQALDRFADRVGSGAGSADDSARLVQFDANGALRLAWSIRHRASSTEDYQAVVDATTGRVLRRVNLVRFAADAKIYRHFHGAAVGGSQVDVNIDSWLFSPSTATTLTGPYARAFSDLEDDDQPASGEEVDPQSAYTLDTTWAHNTSGGCGLTGPLCSWDSALADSWQANREQNAVQAFWFVNQYRDHLATAPIDFTQATGGFECTPPTCSDPGDDRVIVQTDDGADTAGGLPDGDHVSNANMSTPPDGQAPTMQMYLFSSTDSTDFRDINGGDAAEIVYHEYSHGLSSRLVHDASGVQALNSAQAGAMGEAWSDWYAMDFLTRTDAGPGAPYVADVPGDPGDVDLGAYTDNGVFAIRTQPLDCPVGDAVPGVCPAGGYTYGDFGTIGSGPEVHADGEIWGETLWDLRARLIVQQDNDPIAGSDLAERLITGGMRLSVPEPSFLDMRDAIVAEANVLATSPSPPPHADQLVDLVWEVFEHRGMGFFAGATDGNDTEPAESFDQRPQSDQFGGVAGRITDAVTGKPLPGATIAVPGHGTFTATSGADGGYAIAGLPAGTYPKLVANFGDGHDGAVATNVIVTTGQTVRVDFSVRRNWGATAGGGAISADTDDTGAPYACGAAALIDQSRALGWSAYNPANPDIPAPDETNHLVAGQQPVATIKLPRPVDISAFGADPGNTCGDAPSATTKDFRIETSQDGTTFTTAFDGTTADTRFDPADAGRVNLLTPTAGAQAVRYVRLTLLSPQNTCSNCDGRKFIDFTELAVYGNAVPTGSLAVPASATTADVVPLDASSFTDDSAVTSYAWDFDGDGNVDTTTSGPKTTHNYPVAGAYAPAVRVTDDTAGSSTASGAIAVAQAPVVVPPTVKHVKPRLTLPRQSANRATIAVTCQVRCRITASLKAGKKLARRLKLERWGAGAVRVTRSKGRSTVRVPIARPILRKLRARGMRRVTLSFSVRVRDANGLVSTVRRSPRIPISRR